MRINKKMGVQIFVALLFGLLNSVGINLFLSPATLYGSGVTGIAQLLSSVLGTTVLGMSSIAVWSFLLNVPLIILAWKNLGRRFTLLTLFTVFSSSFFINLLPVITITNNLVLAAIAGGVLTGIGIGLCLRYGFSTGGVDIVALVMQKRNGRSIGQLGMIINGIILLMAGVLYGWELAIASLLSIYVATKMIDLFYIHQSKVTVTIYTRKTNEIVNLLVNHSIRGITVIENAYGGYTKEKVDSVTTVVTKYDLFFVKSIVKECDLEAFVNIQPTIEVVGKYDDSRY
ncbi:YitT family protein [Carnobacterium maltaromaticum]|uniref:YitT family protein n=1 Tax=Carnobacterium maltaromaticum TaxID=2751 RepID=UPI0012F73712|nr:YitT family protein [Carnobacterium maltaromaticum]